MQRSYREKLIAVVTFVAGLYFFLEYVLPKVFFGYQIGKYHQQVSNGFITVGAMAVGLGLINLVVVHGGAILKTRKGWPFSIALLLGLGIMMYFEIAAFVFSEKAVRAWQEIGQLTSYYQVVIDEREAMDPQPRLLAAYSRLGEIIQDTEEPGETLYTEDVEQRQILIASLEELRVLFFLASQRELIAYLSLLLPLEFLPAVAEPSAIEAPLLGAANIPASVTAARNLAKVVSDTKIETSVERRGASFLYQAFFVPLGAAMFSLLAFYVATAAYRTFRVRSVEAAIMMLAAMIVMLGQIPHGPLYVTPKLVPMRLWLLENLSTPAFRAIFFGATIAGLAMAVRMWLSLERSPLDSED